MNSKKEQAYQANVKRSLGEMYDQMIKHLEWMSEEYVDTEVITPEQVSSIWAVQAIEEEWILDEEIRQEMSMVQFED